MEEHSVKIVQFFSHNCYISEFDTAKIENEKIRTKKTS